MSFRGRLRLFFALIVIVPMIALGIVLFALTGRSETGKADAGLAAGTRAAVGIYREEIGRARPALRRISRDRDLHRAIASGRAGAAERRLRELAVGKGTLSVTASFGVAAMPESALDRGGLIAAADAALYAAKRGGKNRVERAGMTVAEPSSRPR